MRFVFTNSKIMYGSEQLSLIIQNHVYSTLYVHQSEEASSLGVKRNKLKLHLHYFGIRKNEPLKRKNSFSRCGKKHLYGLMGLLLKEQTCFLFSNFLHPTGGCVDNFIFEGIVKTTFFYLICTVYRFSI